MPNVRSKNQRLIALPLDARLLAELDRARRGKGRSQFVREAIREKLAAMGIKISEDMIMPPDRARTPMSQSITPFGMSQDAGDGLRVAEAPDGAIDGLAGSLTLNYAGKKSKRKVKK